MESQRNISLKPYNTFGIEAKANYFLKIKTVNELRSFLSNHAAQTPLLVLGGGSNLLFTRDFPGVVLKINIEGIQVIRKDNDYVWVKAGAGENWHQFVLYCIEKELGGIENLSLIPGTVGAAPMQNIGAYGVEIKDVFESLEAVEILTGKVHTFDNKACRFGYRESVFKLELKDQFIITSVVFKLSKTHQVNTSYGAIEATLQEKGIAQPTIRDVSDAVISVRQSKLPDPAVIGNAGSFFKNPVITASQYAHIQAEYENVPGYELPDGGVKVPAGWLIEKCGWKGKKIGEVGVHKMQALVLVNYGNAKGEDVKKLAFDILKSVTDKFNIELTPEVNLI